MHAASSLYLEGEFFGLVALSLLMPGIIAGWLIRRRRISRVSVVLVALTLVILSGTDAILLQRLSAKAKLTSDLLDDRLFASEFSIALYLLPLVTAGIGINLLTHVITEHVVIAELQYDQAKKSK